MKLNKRNIIIAIIILILLVLLCLKQCGTSSLETTKPQDTIIHQSDTITRQKTDTIVQILNVTKNIRDTLVKQEIVIQKDTIIDNRNLLMNDSLQNLLLFTNKEYQAKIEKEQVYINEINSLKTIQKQKEDSIIMLLTLLQKERTNNVLDNTQENKKIANKELYFLPKNILFTGLYIDNKTGAEQETIYGGLLKQILLSMDFISNIPVRQDNRKQTVYIKISDLQTDQLIYITDEKPKTTYGLNDGEKISYSLESSITLNQNNMASLRITYPMKWTLKRNSAIKVEVFYNKQKIGEQINEIKSGIPVTTW